MPLLLRRTLTHVVKIIVGALLVTQQIYAQTIVRRQIKIVGFTKNAKMVFYSNDLACICKTDRCKYTDESGESDCTKNNLETIDIRTDEVKTISPEELKKLEIAGKNLILQKFPLKYQDDNLNAVLGSDCNSDYQSLSKSVKTLKCNVMLESTKRGKKLIKTIEYVPTPHSSFKVIGFFLSPFEPKVAILISQQTSQFEGTSFVREVPIGADLEKGLWN